MGTGTMSFLRPTVRNPTTPNAKPRGLREGKVKSDMGSNTHCVATNQWKDESYIGVM